MAIANPEALNSIVPIQAGGFGGGPTPGGATPWSVIRPTNNDEWSADYYSTTEPILRGNGQVRFTAGVVSLVRYKNLPGVLASSSLSCIGATGMLPPSIGVTGYAMYQVQGFPAVYYGQVGNVASPSDSPASGSAAYESSNAGLLLMQTVVVSDEIYAGEDAHYLNASKQKPAIPTSWNPVDTAENLYLGRQTGAEASVPLLPTSDWFVGWFYHLEAMTNRELWGLFQNIMLAGKIPDTDAVGGGTVPDYIFDVATQMPVPGTDAAPAIWVSGGATGGLTMTKTGSIDVVNVNPRAFGSRG